MFLSLEHLVHRNLKSNIPEGHSLVLACSGGVDSMVLVEVLRRLRPLHRRSLTVLHVDHGLGDSTTMKFRAEAKALVRSYCEFHGLHFLTNTTFPKKSLNSEAALRGFRQKCFVAAKNYMRADGHLLTAHHWDDLLETRLIQLMRGTGPQGFASVHGLDSGKWLPLLPFSREEIVQYALNRGLKWVEDPTNTKTDALRNWIRNDWLVALDRKQSGLVRQLGLSLERVSSQLRATQKRFEEDFDQILTPQGQINRTSLGKLSKNQRTAFLAWFLKRKGLRFYSENHLNEILKRLDKNQKEFRFSLLNVQWVVDAQHIQLNPQASNL